MRYTNLLLYVLVLQIMLCCYIFIQLHVEGIICNLILIPLPDAPGGSSTVAVQGRSFRSCMSYSRERCFQACSHPQEQHNPNHWKNLPPWRCSKRRVSSRALTTDAVWLKSLYFASAHFPGKLSICDGFASRTEVLRTYVLEPIFRLRVCVCGCNRDDPHIFWNYPELN